MKKFYLIILIIPFVLISCKSNEEKASDLIRTELSKTLFDFESYEPIETIVTEAKFSAFTDTTIWNHSRALLYIFKKARKVLEESQEAKDHMDIWGPPSYYSSSYSDGQYYKYRKEYMEKFDEATKYYGLLKIGCKELKDSISALDPDATVGWEVRHRFRCKTKGGFPTIGDFRFVVDKKFKTILIEEDTDDEDFKLIREIIDSSLNGTFED